MAMVPNSDVNLVLREFYLSVFCFVIKMKMMKTKFKEVG